MNSASSPSQDGSKTSKPRRRQQPITANACTECRRRRTKCDGKNPCGLCVARGVSNCEYLVHERTAKKMMMDQIGSLNHRYETNNQILRAIATNQDRDEIVQQLKDGESYEAIARHIQSTSSPASESPRSRMSDASSPFEQDAMKITTKDQDNERYGFDKKIQRHGTVSVPTKPDKERGFHDAKGVPDFIGLSLSSIDGGQDYRKGVTQASGPGLDAHQSPSSAPRRQQAIELPGIAGSWTNVTDDQDLVNHLLDLYFYWEYPTFASFSKMHFLHDFQAGRRRFCSSLLVNAILSLACRFLVKAEAPFKLYSSKFTGDDFFKEAKMILADQEDQSLPTIQALGLMSLREASYGRSDLSGFYRSQSIRMAVESELHLDQIGYPGMVFSWEELEVRSITFWGSFALDQAWSLFIGGVPYISRRVISTPVPLIIEVDTETETGREHHADTLLPKTGIKATRDAGLAFRAICGLSARINDALHVLYEPGGGLNIQKILDLHEQYLQWYHSLPKMLRHGVDFSPSALFVHIFYQCAVLLLFRPFVWVSFAPFPISPHDICLQASGNLTTLIRSYRQLHTVERTPTFTPYIILNAAIIALADTTLTDAVSLPLVLQDSLDDLANMSACHAFAKSAIMILQIFAHERRSSLTRSPGHPTTETENLLLPMVSTKPEDLLSLLSLGLFKPNRRLFLGMSTTDPDGVVVNNAIASHDAVLRERLFSPFTHQGLPLLPIRSLMTP